MPSSDLGIHSGINADFKVRLKLKTQLDLMIFMVMRK